MNFNNNLLNQTYMNNMQNINMFNRQGSFNQTQMSNMYHTMNNLKKMQQSKFLSKINELEKNRDRLQLDKDELRNAIIRPIKIEKTDKQEIVVKFKDLEKNFTKKELEELWNKRTNQAYKNIIKDDKYQKKEYKKKEDLIVHKVTDLDKLGVDVELKEFETKLESQNGELKIIYSQSKELEHKKKFEYNNKYKYTVKFNPKAHEELKDENVEYFKKEQEKLEKDKKKVDDIIQNLLETNILTEEEKNDLSALQDNNDVDNNTNENNDINEVQEESSPKSKTIKVTVKTKKVDEIVEENNNHIDIKIDDEVRNKYLNRKKIIK